MTKERSKRSKTGLNTKALCLTSDEVLKELKTKEILKAEAEKKKEAKRQELKMKKEMREKKKKEQEMKKMKKSLQEKRSEDRLKGQRSLRASIRVKTKKLEVVSEEDKSLINPLSELQLSDDSFDTESDATCPKCGLLYSEIGGLWVFCEGCNQWLDLKCTAIKKNQQIPEHFFVNTVLSLGLSRPLFHYDIV